LGLIELNNNNTEKAKEMFDNCLEICPEFPLGLLGLGLYYYEIGDYDKSEQNLKHAYELDPNELQTVICLANTLIFKGAYYEAINLYKKALKLDPKIVDIHYSLGNAYYLLNDIDNAISNYILAIKDKENMKVETFYSLGNALCLKNKFREAIMCYKQSIKYDPNNGEIYYNLGNCYFITGDKMKAIGRYQEAIEKNYNTDEVRVSLIRAMISSEEKEFVIKGRKYLEDIIYKMDHNVEILYLYAQIMENEDKEQALNYYQVIYFLF
jgi:tetratricopeptide (TPR) repeat protein